MLYPVLLPAARGGGAPASEASGPPLAAECPSESVVFGLCAVCPALDVPNGLGAPSSDNCDHPLMSVSGLDVCAYLLKIVFLVLIVWKMSEEEVALQKCRKYKQI